MDIGHVHALLGVIVFIATMVLAPYPLVAIRASAILGNILNATCGKSWLFGSNSLSLPFSISISVVGRILGSLLGEHFCQGNYWLIGDYLVLVPLSGGILIDAEVCCVNAELFGVKLAVSLNPFALMTLNIVEEIRAAGLGKLLEAKGKPEFLIKFTPSFQRVLIPFLLSCILVR